MGGSGIKGLRVIFCIHFLFQYSSLKSAKNSCDQQLTELTTELDELKLWRDKVQCNYY